MNKSNYLSLGLSVLAIVISLVAIGSASQTFGVAPTGAGITNFTKLDALQGYFVNGVAVLNASGTFTSINGINTTGTVTIGTSGTAINKYLCATKSFAPGTLNYVTGASTTVSVSGVVAGDELIASFDSTTSTNAWHVFANVTGNGTTTAVFESIASTSVTLTTSTVKVCMIH